MTTLSKQAILEIHDLCAKLGVCPKAHKATVSTADVPLAQRRQHSCQAVCPRDEIRKLYVEALGDQINGTAAQHRARHEVMFRRYVLAKTPQDQKRMLNEYRDAAFQAGTQAITYTEGATGGMLVPMSFYDAVITGMAQTDPLLSDDNVTLIAEPTYAMKPKQLPGYDLTTIAATRVVENTDNGVPDAFPASSAEVLNGYPYRLATYATVEITDDDFETAMASVGRAHGVGLARGIGSDLVNGTGSSQPQGLLTGASNSGYTTASGECNFGHGH